MYNNDFNNQPDIFSSDRLKDRRFPSVQKTSLFILIVFISFFAVNILVSLFLVGFDFIEQYDNNATFNYILNSVFEILYLGVPVLIMLMYYNSDRKYMLRLNPMSGKEIVYTVIIGVLVFIANIYLTEVNYLVATFISDVEIPAEPEILTVADKLAYMFLLIIIAPVFEEITMRGIIMRGLEGKSKWFAFLVTGFFFGMLHLSYYSFVPKILVGILLCYIVYITDSIYAGIIVHMMNNGISGIISLMATGTVEQEGEEIIEEITASEAMSSIIIYLVISAAFIIGIISLLSAIRNSTKRVSEEGIYIYKENIREKLPCEHTIKWYAYIPIIITFVLMAAHMVADCLG